MVAQRTWHKSTVNLGSCHTVRRSQAGSSSFQPTAHSQRAKRRATFVLISLLVSSPRIVGDLGTVPSSSKASLDAPASTHPSTQRLAASASLAATEPVDQPVGALGTLWQFKSFSPSVAGQADATGQHRWCFALAVDPGPANHIAQRQHRQGSCCTAAPLP